MIEKKKILGQIKSVPSLPSVVVQLRQYLNDPNVEFAELAKVIEYDPGLTANILQLANSAYFGWSGKIKTVKEAITRLGISRIFQMVLCMSVAPLISKPIKGYDISAGDLWEHSIATAICAELLADSLNMKGVEEVFTAALLHDLGKIILGTFVEVDVEPINELVDGQGYAFNEAELEVLGIDHAGAAAELLLSWSLPVEVVAAARWHHQPSQADSDFQRLVDLVHVADHLCMEAGWGLGRDSARYRRDPAAYERLGLADDTADDVAQKVMEGIGELKELFNPSFA